MGNYRYAVATDSRDGQTLAVLEDAEGGRRLQAALHGGVVFGFSVTSGARGSRHGFVRDADFELIASDADDDHASVTLATRAIRLEPGAERVFRCGVELDIAA